MYKSKQRRIMEKNVSFRVFKVFVAVALFCFGSALLAVPENLLRERSTEIEDFFTSKMKVAEFTGKDGTRLAYAWVDGDPALPPVVVSVGLGESYLHYKEIVYDLMAEGDFRQSFFVFDLRSQGLSQKLAPDEGLFHIESFDDYVTDLEIFIESIVKPKYPEAPRIMAHSTGGLIAFILLSRRPELAERVIYVAPLFGLNYGGTPNWLMKILARTLSVVGFHNKAIPFRGQGLNRPFAQNQLTYSEQRYDRMLDLRTLSAFKKSSGPSIGFVVATQAALSTAIAKAESYKTPSVVLTADEDAYVSTPESERYCKAMSDCEYVAFKNARHVLLHERDEVRDRVMNKIKEVLVVKPEETP